MLMLNNTTLKNEETFACMSENFFSCAWGISTILESWAWHPIQKSKEGYSKPDTYADFWELGGGNKNIGNSNKKCPKIGEMVFQGDPGLRPPTLPFYLPVMDNININQFGNIHEYRHSIISLAYVIYKAIEKANTSINLFPIDLRKAFDLLSDSVLLKKIPFGSKCDTN